MCVIDGVVIAAAGLGSRVGLGIPKCLIEVDGIPILTRLIGCLKGKVNKVHIVVGYREEMIFEYCAQHHRDVVLVRNPAYRSTMTSQSYALGARHLAGTVLYLDGDLIVDPAGMGAFIARAATVPVLVGITKAKSEHAVYAQTGLLGETSVVVDFNNGPSDHEWANVVAAPSDFFSQSEGHVFKTLAMHLPLPAFELDVLEIDTQTDLQAVKARFER